jgi:hypothetical protein
MLLPQAGIDFGNQTPTVSLNAIRLHVKGHPSIKFFILSGLPAITETPDNGTSNTTKPPDRLQHALADAAGGIANVSLAKQIERGWFTFDGRASGKVVEVPDQEASAGEGGFTLRPVAGASARFEARVPLVDDNEDEWGVLFGNVTAVYNFVQPDIADRFDTALKKQNFNISGAAGLDLPKAKFYVAFVFSIYNNDGQFDQRYMLSFNPHR